MQGLGETFDVEETCVEPAQPFHVPMLGAMTARRTQSGRTATGSANFTARPADELLQLIVPEWLSHPPFTPRQRPVGVSFEATSRLPGM